jgi:hypothetical protein
MYLTELLKSMFDIQTKIPSIRLTKSLINAAIRTLQ